jgi:polar amino acid transport system substrate-binding protein
MIFLLSTYNRRGNGMTFKSFFLALAAAVMLMATPALAAEKSHFVNGIDAAYPPFAFVDSSGKPSGFDIDSMDWIAEKNGLHRGAQAP